MSAPLSPALLEDRLLAYMDDELTAEEAQALLDAVEADASSMALLDGFRRQERMLDLYYHRMREAFADAPRPDVEKLAPRADVRREGRGWWKWGLAAALVIGAGFGVATLRTKVSPVQGIGTVLRAVGVSQSIDNGGLFALAANALLPSETKKLKTGANGFLEVALPEEEGTLELNANSSVELVQRGSVREFQLDRGEVLLRTLENPDGRMLRVRTPQLLAETSDGTFSMVRGLRGAEIIVLEGSVFIEEGGRKLILSQGEHLLTGQGSYLMPLSERLSWSPTGRMLAKNSTPSEGPVAVGMAATITDGDSGGMFIAEGVAAPPIRVAASTQYMPKDTFIVVELSDIGAMLQPLGISSLDALMTDEALAEFEEKFAMAGVPGNQMDGFRAVAKFVISSPDLRTLAGALRGSATFGSTEGGAIFIADVSADPDGVRAIFDQRLLPMLRALDPEFSAFGVAVEGDMLVIASDAGQLEEVRQYLLARTPSPFTNGEVFREFRADSAGSNYNVLFDVRGMLQRYQNKNEDTEQRQQTDAFLKFAGLDNLRSVIVATGAGDDAGNQPLRIRFDGMRHGVAGWLAEPGALGSLRYFSPDAKGILAAKIISPEHMLTGILDWMEESKIPIPRPESAEEIRLARSVAAALGNEVCVGLDNPLLPIPNIKVAMEVIDPKAFQDRMAEFIKMMASRTPEMSNVTIDSRIYRGRPVVDFRYPGLSFGLAYGIHDDFVIFGPGRAFVENAIDVALDGLSIDRERAFIDAMPEKSGSHVSLLLYQSMGRDRDAVSKFVSGMAPPEVRNAITLPQGEATFVAYAIAADDRIDVLFEGIKSGDFSMAGLVPAIAGWYQPTAPQTPKE